MSNIYDADILGDLKNERVDVRHRVGCLGNLIRDEAARAHNRRTSSYLLGMPLLPDFLEEGLSMLGHSCEEFEHDRL